MEVPPEPTSGSPPSAAPQQGTAAPVADWTPSFNPWLVAIAVSSATFMEVLDTSVANVSLPHIAGNLSATPEEATWVLTSYLVSNAIVLPAAAWLTSLFGRKRFLVVCITIFTVASILSGAATSLGMLVTARVFQGLGGGALQPIAQSVLLESFPPAKRGQAMAMYGMGIVVAPIIGPTLGGWITDNFSWRWIFYINVPIGVLAVFMAQTFVEDPPYLKKTGVRQIDYIGFGLMALWVATLQIILDKGQQDDWFAAPWIRWCTILTVVSFVGFILWELVQRDPIVHLRVLHDRNFSVATAMIAVVGLALYGTNVLLPLFLQDVMGYPALNSGLAVSPRGLGAFLSMMMVGPLVSRVDNRYLITGGFLTLAATMFMFSDINLDITIWSVAMPNILSGLAIGFIFVPLTTMSTATLPQSEIANASGINNLMRNLGGSFGISIVTTLVSRAAQMHQNMLAAHTTPYDPPFMQALHRMQGALAGTFGTVASQQHAIAIMNMQLEQQANVVAYVDVFRTMTIICACAIPLILFTRKTVGSAGAAAMH